MKIFTFWEPKSNLPEYLKLCMRTWEKFIPDAEVILLDFNNLFDYIDREEINEKLFNSYFSLPQIADVIRAILLEKYGGIWMDVDTIILREDAVRYIEGSHSVTFFGNPDAQTTHICWINAKKNADLLKHWVEKADEKIRDFNTDKLDEQFWSYLGNSIVDPYIGTHSDEVKIIDVVKENCMPERRQGGNNPRNYAEYYFVKNYHLSDIDSSMILLHNSWTPAQFKKMSLNEFILQDCTISNVLCEALDIDKSEYILSYHECSVLNELIESLYEASQYMANPNNSNRDALKMDCLQILKRVLEVLVKKSYYVEDVTLLYDMRDTMKILLEKDTDYTSFNRMIKTIKEKFKQSVTCDTTKIY